MIDSPAFLVFSLELFPFEWYRISGVDPGVNLMKFLVNLLKVFSRL
jgi:hypothetical protein